MQLLLGIKLLDETKQLISDQLRVLQDDYSDANWTPKNNYHIVLEYFGTFPQYKPLIPVLAEAAFENVPFSLMTLSRGVFIDERLTLYIDFYKNKAIEDLVKTVREKLAIDNKFRYIPQITVGKARVPSKQQYFLIKKKFERLKFEHEFQVNEVTLFESVPAGKGHQAIELATFKLGELTA